MSSAPKLLWLSFATAVGCHTGSVLVLFGHGCCRSSSSLCLFVLSGLNAHKLGFEREAFRLTCGWVFHLGKKEKTKKPVGTKESKARKTSDTAGKTKEVTQGSGGRRWWWWGCSCVHVSSFVAASGDLQQDDPGLTALLCAVHATEEPFFLPLPSRPVGRK